MKDTRALSYKMETWQSGLSRNFAKVVSRKVPKVRILPFPPMKDKMDKVVAKVYVRKITIDLPLRRGFWNHIINNEKDQSNKEKKPNKNKKWYQHYMVTHEE